MRTPHTHSFILAICLLLGAPLAPAADPPPTPTAAKGVDVISPEEAKRLIGKARFFDMRSAVNYGKGHIEGAVALPYDQKSELAENFDAAKDKFDASKLPADKNTAVVFYGDGPAGWKSYKAAVTAAKMGHKNVMWMRDGTAGWLAKGFALK